MSDYPWKSAVIDGLVINFELKHQHENDPRLAVADLVESSIKMALDPQISSDAQALIDRGIASVWVSINDRSPQRNMPVIYCNEHGYRVADEWRDEHHKQFCTYWLNSTPPGIKP